MATICRSYDAPEEADHAVARLLEAGVPGDDVRLLIGAKTHDARQGGAGSYGGSVPEGDSAGSFGGSATAAVGGFAGDSGGRPEGVFANTDRDIVVSYVDGREQVRVAGHGLLKGLLRDAGLDEAAAERDVHALHDGRSLVLVIAAGGEVRDLASILEDHQSA